MEELEGRFLLSGFSYPSLVQAGEVGGQTGSGGLAVQNITVAGSQDDGNPDALVVVGAQRSGSLDSSPAPIPGNGINATPAERSQTTYSSAGLNPPLAVIVEFVVFVPDASAQVPGISLVSSPVRTAGADAGFVSTTEVASLDSGPAPNAGETNVATGTLVFPGSTSDINVMPAERSPVTTFAAGANPPLASGAEILTAIREVTAQVPVSPPGPSPIRVAGADAGFIFNTSGFQLHPLPSFSGYSTFLEPAVPSGTQAQGWLSLPPPSPGMIAPFHLSELHSPVGGGHSTLSSPSESGPLGQREVLLAPPDLSALEDGLLQFLAELGPRGQEAVPLPPPDLSALEAGLLRFLTELGQTSSPLAVDQDRAALWMWLLAAAGAGVACEIAYRQYRQPAGEGAPDIPSLAGFSLDDVL
jgi:hypothetical protein